MRLTKLDEITDCKKVQYAQSKKKQAESLVKSSI